MQTTVTAREQLRELARQEPDITATEAARRLGVSRQRVQSLAMEEEIELARYVRGSTPLLELSGTVSRARRTLEAVRASIAEARTVERALVKQLRQAERTAKRRKG